MNSDMQVKIKDSSAISYHAFVQKLVKVFPRFMALMKEDGKFSIKDAEASHDDLANRLEICHSAMGIHTEAGEVADVLKAHAIYGKELDRAALIKELGDVRFWIMDIQNKFHISDREIVQGNADKLSERYAKMQYSYREAIARKDKKYVVATGFDACVRGEYIAGPFEHVYEAEQAREAAEEKSLIPLFVYSGT